MKKFAKLIFGTAIIASIAAGAYYIFKTYIQKDTTDDFDDFDDEFEEFDTEEDDDATEEDTREYVSINLDGNEPSADEAASEQEDEEV